MHVLITNDDGPPSDQSSPYVHSLVSTLQAHSHTVSVILPHTQRSWIGKAHLVGKSVVPTYYRPQPLRVDPETNLLHNSGTISTTPLPQRQSQPKASLTDAETEKDSSEQDEWLLIDSTPASCIQIGLYHYFAEARGPIDLVISGPNYGRNSTAVFSLSSGTIGGAMEAAVCGVRSIALSYAFFDRNHDAGVIAEASELSAKLVEHLYENWDDEVHLYSVNVPLQQGVSARRILYTEVLQNAWRSGSCFQVLDAPTESTKGDGVSAPQESEASIRKQEEKSSERQKIQRAAETASGATEPNGSNAQTHPRKPAPMRFTHQHFQWAPRFKDVYDSVAQSSEGNDGWAVAHGFTSVTPLRANFMHVAGQRFEGREIKL